MHKFSKSHLSFVIWKRWAGIAALGTLSAGAVVTIGWAIPRPGGEHFLLAPRPSASDSNSPNRQNQTANPQFMGKLRITELSEDEAILHALNRLGFGPRPGEVDKIRKSGLENWIQAQLHPESIDDHAAEA